MYKTLLIIFSALVINLAKAEEINFSSSLGLELRGFIQNPVSSVQASGVIPSVFYEPEIKWRSDDRAQRFSFVGFSRYDNQDSDRTHSDLRELYWSYNHQNWTTTIGINKVFWGVTESSHLIDVINQTDLVEDIDQEDKLGQPMIHFSNQKDWGKLDFFILPYFRERTFSGLDGRFSFGLAVDDNSIYQSSSKKRHVDYAFRYSHYFGDVDLGLYIFDGTNREPRLSPSSNFSKLIATYDQMTQIGIDLQYTREAWLWKLESLYRETKIDDFVAVVAGFEYTFFQIKGVADLGLLMEYQYDGRNDLSAPTSADNDLFLATRLAFNDSQDTSILAGVVIDIENNSTFVNIEAQRRLAQNLSAELRIRVLTNVEPTDSIFAFANDDYVQLSLNWFF